MRFEIKTRWGRVKAWLYAMFVEHNFTNVIRYNFHPITNNAYRSSQPTMYQLERDVKKYGIKTILNLKHYNPGSAYYVFEKEMCDRLGIKMVDIHIHSRGIPTVEQLQIARDTFEEIEYPMWMHCKAGADRTGIYATLFQYFHLKMPIEDTDQLKLYPFGHIRQSNAGKFDYYLEKFLEHKEGDPDIDLITWAENHVDRKSLEKSFQPEGFMSFLNDAILRRE